MKSYTNRIEEYYKDSSVLEGNDISKNYLSMRTLHKL